MDLPRIVLAPFRAVRRAIDWVYAPLPHRGPSRSEAIVHLWVNAHGIESDRWMAIESEERRQRNLAVIHAEQGRPPDDD